MKRVCLPDGEILRAHRFPLGKTGGLIEAGGLLEQGVQTRGRVSAG